MNYANLGVRYSAATTESSDTYCISNHPDGFNGMAVSISGDPPKAKKSDKVPFWKKFERKRK